MIKSVLKECIPTVLSLMMLSMYSVIDGLFIGNFAGDVGLAAINIAWPITALIMASGVGVGIGSSILISHERGKKNEVRVQEIFQVGVTLLCVVSVILFVILVPFAKKNLIQIGAMDAVLEEAYRYSFIIIWGLTFQVMGAGMIPVLRNFQLSKQAMYCMGLGTILNIIVNYYLICVMQIGIRGAAYGTIIAQSIVSFLAFYLLWNHVKPKWRWNPPLAWKIIKVGITGFGMSLAPSITLIFTNWQCLRYGGESAVACYAVISYIAWPIQGMLSGVGEGCQPLMSYYCGAKELGKVKEVTKIARWFACIFSLIMSGIVWLCIPYIAGWFGLSEDGTILFVTGMKIYAFSFLVISMARFNICYLNAMLQTKRATILTYLESLLISPILLFVLPLFWEIKGIWLSYIASGVILLALYFLLMQKKQSRIIAVQKGRSKSQSVK